MPRPTPNDVLEGIEDSEDEDAVDAVSATTPEQRSAELEAAGYDLAELNAKADAVHAMIARAPVEARVKELETAARRRSLRPRAKRSPVVLWLAAAATAVIGGGLVYTLSTQPPSPSKTAPPVATTPTPVAPVIDLRAAAGIRRRALAACDARQWPECLSGLEDAKRLDPGGDTSPEVQLARQNAARANEDGPKQPKH